MSFLLCNSFLLSSKLDDRCISINIGTGAQVSLLVNDYIGSDNYEIRPYINSAFTKCVTGLPGGRLLGLFEKFIKNVLHEYYQLILIDKKYLMLDIELVFLLFVA